MKTEIICAIIALIGVFVSAILSFLIGVFQKRFNYKNLFAETVSSSRNIWLNEMRQYISNMLAEAVGTKDRYKNKEYYQNRNQVLLRLNLKEPAHCYLKCEIEKLDCCTTANYEILEKRILDITNHILKEEWEKVKREARGKR